MLYVIIVPFWYYATVYMSSNDISPNKQTLLFHKIPMRKNMGFSLMMSKLF